MGKLKILGDVVEGGLGMMRNASKAEDAAKEVTAAERAAAGRKAAELIKSQQQVKASEALGQLREKGVKRTTTTQADRTRVGGGNIGGAPFSAISEADPLYAGKVWGVMDEGTASRLTNLTDPETAWTTMLGSANQLKTNPIVFDKLKKGFLESMKQGNLSPELEAKINHNLALTFGEGASIRDPSIWKQADTFEKRGALADLMMGQGITPKKGGIALGGEKSGKGVIFKPTDILKKETEPYLLHTEHGGDIPTFAAGPRLFKLEKESEFRPDLHPGFPTLIKGKDLGYNVIPTPTEIYLPDWHKAFKQKKPERFQGPWSPEIVQRRKSGSYQLKGAEGPGYYDLALGLEGEGLPSQELTDEYIRHLIREGFKKGGAVEDFDAKVDKLIENHRFDSHVDKRIEEHFAKGGNVKLATTSLRMAGGGMMAKGMAKLGKRLMADPAEVTASIKGGTRRFGDEMGGNTIIKDTGGNWLKGSVEDSLKPLKQTTASRYDAEMALNQMRHQYTPEALAKLTPALREGVLRNFDELEKKVAGNKWVDRNLTNYVKKQMGTADDPVRKLAEEGIIHTPTEEVGINRYKAKEHREKNKGEQLGESEAARAWEDASDVAMRPIGLKDVPNAYREPWMDTAPADTTVHHLTGVFDNQALGFDHIMDVLRADVEAGRIRPEQLSKVSMEQAVRRTYEYDQEMARKMAESQFEVTKDMPIHKDYADKGYKWIELAPKKDRKPYTEENLPQGYALEQDRDGFYQVRNKNVGEVPTTDSFSKTPEESIAKFNKWAKDKDFELQSALKYEGDTMGHCVGSYCDDVTEGNKRIFSLRDSKGEPHVTIETQPRSLSTWDDVTAAVGPEESQKLWKEFDDIGGNSMSDVGQGFDMFIKQKGIQAPEKIVQIKGKGNAKPKDDYLPFVQDFVRGGNWSDVGDFKNTGLLQPYEVIGEESLKALKAKGIPIPKYLTKEEADELGKQAIRASDIPTIDEAAKLLPPAEGMARGGGILKYTTLRMGKGGLLGKGAKALAGAMKGEDLTSQAIGKAAESAGMKAPVTANKPLTGLQDFHTSLGDSIRQRVARDQELMNSFDYKYDKGQRVFTEDSARKNWPPMTVLGRVLEGNRIMREDPNDFLSKKIIDEATGKAKRTPHEPGYKVRLEHSPDNWSEFVIPETAIKGSVDFARGGGVLKYTTLRNRNTTQSQPNRFADGGKSEMKETPRNKYYGTASDLLKEFHEFASKPFGYENPPAEFLSEFVGIPAASRVLNKKSYGESITNMDKANVPLIPDDTFDAFGALLGGLGTASKAGKLAKSAIKGRATGGSIIQHTTLRNRKPNQRVR